MFSIRNIGGVALFLFGTTWLMPFDAAKGTNTTGAAWATADVLAAAVIIGFTVATWGLFRRATWWENLATISAIVCLVTLAPYKAHGQGRKRACLQGQPLHRPARGDSWAACLRRRSTHLKPFPFRQRATTVARDMVGEPA